MSSINQPLTLRFGDRTYQVPTPKARVGRRVSIVLGSVDNAVNSDQKIDPDKLLRDMGVDDPENYDMTVDLFGADLNNQLLDELTVDEYDIATQAMFLWVTPGAGRAAAEAFLADPTGGGPKRPQDHKPKAKRTPRKPTPKTSSSQ